MFLRIACITMIVVGILMIAFTSLNFVTSDRVVDVGPLHLDKEQNHFFQWSPIIGVVLLLAGVVVLILDKRRAKAK